MNSNKTKKFDFKSKHLEIDTIHHLGDNRREIIEQLSKDIRKHHNRIQIKLVDFDKRFVCALFELIRTYKRFRYAIYSLFYRIQSSILNDNGELETTPNLVISFNDVNSHLILFNYRYFQYIFNSLGESSQLRPVCLSLTFMDLIERDEIIRAWTSIVNSWLIRKIKYETHWAYLSTFGGAYSSLGESSKEHAINAEFISKKQLILASEFNDPNAISRCKIFLSFSFIQQERFKEARIILKQEYRYLRDPANALKITDHKLIVMCIAGLKRLRHLDLSHLKIDLSNGEKKR